MSLTDKLAQERRGRLAAERLLELKSKELFEANRKLSLHALKLTDSLVEQRAETQSARSEAAALKGKATEVQAELEKAEEAIGMAERRLWDSVETITDGFAVFDPQDKLIAANSAWMSLFAELDGFGKGSTYLEMLQVCVTEGLVDIGDQSPSEWLSAMLTRWDMPEIPNKTIRLWNGRYLNLIDRRARDGDMVCLALDITNTIRREEELRDARTRAESASKAKSAFLAKMSHELRTPMNGVVGMAELLLEGEADEEKRMFIETIRNSGEALLTIINDVLDYSKIEAGRLTLTETSFNMERMAYEVMLLGQSSVANKPLELIVDYDMFLETNFVGDMGRIRQVLTNLVGNAVKFTSDGHVALRLIGVDTDPDNPRRRVHILVEDTGIGIKEDFQEHIFGQFNQVEDEKNRKYEGTGLGLAITRQLVEAMGGSIWVESTPGEGSTFGIALDLDIADGSSEPAIQLENAPRTAWVVMPNALAREVLTRQLMQLQVQAETADSGTAVLEKLKGTDAPDLLIVDDRLSDTDGLKLAATLRQLGHAVPIVLTSNQHLLKASAADRPDVTGVLPRPVLREDLVRTLQAIGTRAAAPPKAIRAVESPPTAHPRKMRVLAAEDNKTNQLVFRKIIKDLDLELTMVENGLEAVKAWETGQPDLIFMDISMPQLDGKEATRRIRAKEAASGQGRVPIVAMTAHALQGDEDEILAAGLDHYLTKPLKKALIHQQIALHAPEGLEPLPMEDPSDIPQSA